MSPLEWPLGAKVSRLLGELDSPSEQTARYAAKQLDEIVYPQLRGRYTFQTADAAREEFYSRLRITSIPDLLIGTISYGLPNARRYALSALAHMGDTRARPLILTALKDPEALVRVGAINCCSYLQVDTAVPSLIELLADQSADVVTGAARALVNLGALEAIPHLHRLVASDNWRYRESAVGALGDIKDQASLPLVRAALRDRHRSVRKTAKFALSNFDWERRKDVR